jgi:hypothetical protein
MDAGGVRGDGDVKSIVHNDTTRGRRRLADGLTHEGQEDCPFKRRLADLNEVDSCRSRLSNQSGHSSCTRCDETNERKSHVHECRRNDSGLRFFCRFVSPLGMSGE